jgi:hypothetical protein
VKNIIIFFLLLILTNSGCKRHLTADQIQDSLKSAMQQYLNSQKNIDTAKIKFTVLDVVYFEDRTLYNCEFRVKMRFPAKDTIGKMGAKISKDFSDVKRRF